MNPGTVSNPTRRPPEVLAPAGDAQSLQAALVAGADAVYFGLQEGFNARARAGNFSLDTLAATVDSIHSAGARAYLAMNTLLFEPELPFAERVLLAAAAAGVDAIIVQDPALALLARRVAPTLAIHASTQMTISSPEAAAFAQDLGAVRVVVPRELSVREIATFMAGTPLEVEVFVHGALCVSWSGQCLTSEAWGGRSANRGQCAQSCRMPYDLVLDGVVQDLGDVKYLLSPKDLAGARAVPELAALGVRGLKKGRQKGPQYVATAVQGYRRWVDAAARGDTAAPAAQAQLRDDLLAMSLSYTRGFGDGFLAGSDHQTLVEGRFPKHRGVYLGRVVGVERTAVVVETERAGRPWTGALAVPERASKPEGEVAAPLPPLGGRKDSASGPAVAPLQPRPGMGVVFDAGHPEDKNEAGGPLFRVEARGRQWVLGFGTPGPDLRRVTVGQRVWVTGDPAVSRAVDKSLATGLPTVRCGVQLAIEGRAGAALRVHALAGAVQVTATSTARLTPATGAGLTDAILRDKLGALGETPFELTGLDTSGLAAGLHLPVSELKMLRRAVTDALLQAGALMPGADSAGAKAPLPGTAMPGMERPHFGSGPAHRDDEFAAAVPELVVLCRNSAQLAAVIAAGLPAVELDWMEMTGLGHAVESARGAGLQVTVATLRVQKPGEDSFDQRLARLQPDGVLVRHWGGMVHFARERSTQPEAWSNRRIHGDFSLNVTNSVTAHHLLDWGLDTLTPAHDLDEDQLLALLDHVPPERMTVVVHHRIATFHTEHCVYAHLLSHGRDFRSCGRPCESHEVGLRDHLLQTHPVIVDAGCRNTVFNSRPQSSAALVPGLVRRGVRRFRIEFVRETAAEAAAVIAAYSDLLSGAESPGGLLSRLGVTAQQGISAQRMQLLNAAPPGAGAGARS